MTTVTPQAAPLIDLASGPTVPTSGSDPIQRHGHVLITVNEVDLDSVPVNNGASSQVSLYDASSGLGNIPYQFTASPGVSSN